MKLNKQQLRLIRALVDTTDSKGYSLKEIKERSGLRISFDNLEKAISSIGGLGFKVRNSKQGYYIRHADVYNSEIYDEIMQRNDPVINLYIAPGRGGIASKLFDPEVTRGLHLYLANNQAIIGGRVVKEGSLLDSLDAIVMVGGLVPEVPAKPQNKSSDGPRSLLPEGIESIDDAVERSSYMLQQMFTGYHGPILYQPGEEDEKNFDHMKTAVKDEIRAARSEIKRKRNALFGLGNKTHDAYVKRVLALHTLDILREAYEFILKESPYSEEQLMGRSKPAKNSYSSLLDQYIENMEAEFANGFSWEEKFFEKVNGEKIEPEWKAEIREEYDKSLPTQIIDDLRRCATYSRLGHRIKMPEKQINASEAYLIFAGKQTGELESELKDLRETLWALGWLEDKDLRDANFKDMNTLDSQVQKSLLESYASAGKGLDLRILDNNQNFLDINGLGINVRYHAVDTNPGWSTPSLGNMQTEMKERGNKHDYVPDVWLAGPSSTGLGIVMESKYPEDMVHAPVLEYSKAMSPTMFITLGNMYNEDARKFKYSGKGSGYPDRTSRQGQIVVHITDVHGEQQYHIIDIEDLKNLGKNVVYDPSINVLPFDDLHVGDGAPILQDTNLMNIEAACHHITEQLVPHLGVPQVVKMSEFLDGAQLFGSRDLAHGSERLSSHQYNGAVKNIEESKLPEDKKRKLIAELGRMQTEAPHEVSIDDQMRDFMRSCAGDMVTDFLRNGSYLFAIRGDHDGRTSGSRGNEASRLQACFVNNKEDGVSLADRIKGAGDAGETMGELLTKIYGGPKIYNLHKIQSKDYISHLRSARISSEYHHVLAAHIHHATVLHAGGQGVIIPNGMAHAYQHIREKGLSPSMHGVTWANFPREDSPYRNSMSVYFANDLVRQDPNTAARRKIREEVVKFIPSSK